MDCIYLAETEFCYKIGITQGCPQTRAQALSSNSSKGGLPRVVHTLTSFFYVDLAIEGYNFDFDCYEIERVIHLTLNRYRVIDEYFIKNSYVAHVFSIFKSDWSVDNFSAHWDVPCCIFKDFLYNYYLDDEYRDHSCKKIRRKRESSEGLRLSATIDNNSITDLSNRAGRRYEPSKIRY
jgi:hypothetical protein